MAVPTGRTGAWHCSRGFYPRWAALAQDRAPPRAAGGSGSRQEGGDV